MTRSAYRLAVTALIVAVLTLLVALVLVARDGVGSGALLFGVPPVVVAAVGCLSLYTASRLRQRWPLTIGLVVQAVSAAGAAVSFITSLLLAMVPVSGLLIAATMSEMTTARVDTSYS